MCTISGILHNLSLLYDLMTPGDSRLLGGEPSIATPALQIPYLDDVKRTLAEISLIFESATRDYKSGKRKDILRRNLKLPSTNENIDDLLEELSRHVETLILAVNADTLDQILQMGRGQEKLINMVNSMTAILVKKDRS
jgi:hypothetical protein